MNGEPVGRVCSGPGERQTGVKSLQERHLHEVSHSHRRPRRILNMGTKTHLSAGSAPRPRWPHLGRLACVPGEASGAARRSQATHADIYYVHVKSRSHLDIRLIPTGSTCFCGPTSAAGQLIEKLLRPVPDTARHRLWFADRFLLM